MILPARAPFDAAMLDLSLVSLLSAALMAWQVRAPFAIDPREGRQLAPVWMGVLLAGAASGWIVGEPQGALVATLLVLALTTALSRAMPRLSIAGSLSLVAQPLMLLTALPWMLIVLAENQYPLWATMIFTGVALVGVVFLGLTLAGTMVRQALTTHVSWQRPNAPLPPKSDKTGPKVSVQVACYAEPPELVIATLDSIAAQTYRNFEVMVCDNNTKDENLWRPLEAHCRQLNRQIGREVFRFFHVAPLDGAKAGALNYLIDRMAPDAELIAVMDADYLAEPDFLARLTGFFDNPKIGYVQTPHDYRAYEQSSYLKACYWEYMPTNRVVYPGINEYNAAFTIGTMCIVRAQALREIGGWAEWCLTEDSEVSVRFRQIGFDGIYLSQTFGRGLIPETFEDYRKQRFRWTAGPVQQLVRYWRYFVPTALGGLPSGLNRWSKLLEAQRSASPLVEAFGLAFGIFVMIATLGLTVAGALPEVRFPDVAWMILASGMAANVIQKYRRYKLTGCDRVSDMLLAETAQASLSYIQMTAAVAGLSTKPKPWTRTPKFAVESSWARAFTATMPETIIGAAHVLMIALCLTFAGEIGSHMLIFAAAAFAISGARFLAAPAMAVLGERDLARTAQAEREKAGLAVTVAKVAIPDVA